MDRSVGPFSGDPYGRMSFLPAKTKNTGRGFLPDRASVELVEALGNFKVLSRSQMRALEIPSGNGLLGLLCRFGFVSKLETKRTPPLYALGPDGSTMLRVPKREWTVPEAFRVAAANQLYVRLAGEVRDWVTEPHAGLNARFTSDGLSFGVLAPRLWPGELDWCRTLLELSDEPAHVVVAASEEQAEELARLLPRKGVLCFTWDALLASPEAFGLYAGRNRVPVKNLSEVVDEVVQSVLD